MPGTIKKQPPVVSAWWHEVCRLRYARLRLTTGNPGRAGLGTLPIPRLRLATGNHGVAGLGTLA